MAHKPGAVTEVDWSGLTIKHTVNRLFIEGAHIILSDAAFIGDMDHIANRVFGHMPCRYNHVP